MAAWCCLGNLSTGATSTGGVVVGDECIIDQDTGSMGVEIVGHVVALFHHVGAHLVKGRGRDQVALAVDLPGDGGVRGTDGVVTRSSGGGSGVDGHVGSHSELGLDNHTAEEVWVVVGFIVDNGEDLGLDTNSIGNILGRESEEGFQVEVAHDTIVERSLVLVGGSTGSSSRVGPVDLVGLSNLHGLVTELPLVRGGELGIFGVVVVALESLAGLSSELAALVDGGRSADLLLTEFTVLVVDAGIAIVLSGRVVLGTQMPMDIDRAESGLVVRSSDGLDIDLEVPVVSLGDVGTGLGSGNNDLSTDIGIIVIDGEEALNVGEVNLLLVADVGGLKGSSDSQHGGRFFHCHRRGCFLASLVSEHDSYGNSPDKESGSSYTEEGGLVVVSLGGFGVNHLGLRDNDLVIYF
mmetsp:Transcript_14916/g.34522  ORF Transcript_14916/g.34522 Transcript_14916/m.34522 type:complete len:408 (-) Transcript_14916:79-1302(-)